MNGAETKIIIILPCCRPFAHPKESIEMKAIHAAPRDAFDGL